MPQHIRFNFDHVPSPDPSSVWALLNDSSAGSSLGDGQPQQKHYCKAKRRLDCETISNSIEDEAVIQQDSDGSRLRKKQKAAAEEEADKRCVNTAASILAQHIRFDLDDGPSPDSSSVSALLNDSAAGSPLEAFQQPSKQRSSKAKHDQEQAKKAVGRQKSDGGGKYRLEEKKKRKELLRRRLINAVSKRRHPLQHSRLLLAHWRPPRLLRRALLSCRQLSKPLAASHQPQLRPLPKPVSQLSLLGRRLMCTLTRPSPDLGVKKNWMNWSKWWSPTSEWARKSTGRP